jgi:hypothetical protein
MVLFGDVCQILIGWHAAAATELSRRGLPYQIVELVFCFVRPGVQATRPAVGQQNSAPLPHANLA